MLESELEWECEMLDVLCWPFGGRSCFAGCLHLQRMTMEMDQDVDVDSVVDCVPMLDHWSCPTFGAELH